MNISHDILADKLILATSSWYAMVMTSEHFDGLLDALLDRSPFQPFTVELTGGHQFEVDHPRAMVVRDGVAVFLRPGGVPVWFDHESVTQITGDIINAPHDEQ